MLSLRWRPGPSGYLERALGLMRKRAVVRDRVEWGPLLREAREMALGARAPEDTYPAIALAVSELQRHDHHSFFVPPGIARELDLGVTPPSPGFIALFPECVVADVDLGGPADHAGARPGDGIRVINGEPPTGRPRCPRTMRFPGEPDSLVDFYRRLPEVLERRGEPVRLEIERRGESGTFEVTVAPAPVGFERLPSGRGLAGGVGYLELPGGGGHPDYAKTAHEIIRDVGEGAARGWIVALRRNTGGNMWPPLAGAGPILGSGRAGSFVDARSGKEANWSYRDGTALLGFRMMAAVKRPYVPERKTPPVAVLTGPITASAGEALVVSFRGRPDTRCFGEPTTGLSTGNETYRLADGARLVLSTTVEADRTGRVYDGSIPPDQAVRIDWGVVGTEGDSVVEDARAWLAGRTVSP